MLRKLFVALLAAVLLLGAAFPAAQAAGKGVELVNQKDLKIVATGYKFYEFDSGDALWLHATVKNGTGHKICVRIVDAYLDGTEVTGTGIYHIEDGEYREDDSFMFKALEGESSAPLRNPSQYVFTLKVQDEETRDVLYLIPVRFTSTLAEGTRAPKKTAKPTAKPTARPTATPAYMPLQFFKGAYVEWKDLDNDMFKIRVQVRNTSLLHEVKAFELYMYATDVYGDRIYGEDRVYYATTKRAVEPRGGVVYSDYLTVPCRSQVDKVYFGINRAVYSDGTVVEASKIDYWNWTID